MRLLLLEDEVELAQLIRGSLVRIGFTVDVIDRVEQGAAALDATSYDMLILDRRVPDGDGLQLLLFARNARRSVPVLMLSAYGGAGARVEGLNLGADDYLSKPFQLAELVARVQAILRRPKQISQTTLDAGNLAFDTGTYALLVAGKPISLARRETMLLAQFMRRPKQVVTRENLQNTLFGFDADASQNAIEASVSRLRKALVQGGADQKIHTVRGIGYCLAP